MNDESDNGLRELRERREQLDRLRNEAIERERLHLEKFAHELSLTNAELHDLLPLKRRRRRDKTAEE